MTPEVKAELKGGERLSGNLACHTGLSTYVAAHSRPNLVALVRNFEVSSAPSLAAI